MNIKQERIDIDNKSKPIEFITKEKAINALDTVLGNWVHGGDADCIIAEFEEELDKERKK